jgi:hypothetical protein
MSERNENGLTFEEFVIATNRALENITQGIGLDEIADWDTWSAWNDGMDPEDAAREAFAADDLGALFLDLLDGEAGQTY